MHAEIRWSVYLNKKDMVHQVNLPEWGKYMTFHYTSLELSFKNKMLGLTLVILFVISLLNFKQVFLVLAQQFYSDAMSQPCMHCSSPWYWSRSWDCLEASRLLFLSPSHTRGMFVSSRMSKPIIYWVQSFTSTIA